MTELNEGHGDLEITFSRLNGLLKSLLETLDDHEDACDNIPRPSALNQNSHEHLFSVGSDSPIEWEFAQRSLGEIVENGNPLVQLMYRLLAERESIAASRDYLARRINDLETHVQASSVRIDQLIEEREHHLAEIKNLNIDRVAALNRICLLKHSM